MIQKISKLKKKLNFFVFLVPLEILSYSPDIKISHWLREFFQWIMGKVFREKLMVQMAATHPSRTFPLNFLFFFSSVFVVVSLVITLIVMSYRIHMHEKYPCCPIEGQSSVFVCFH